MLYVHVNAMFYVRMNVVLCIHVNAMPTFT